jgi:hypothetical protein
VRLVNRQVLTPSEAACGPRSVRGIREPQQGARQLGAQFPAPGASGGELCRGLLRALRWWWSWAKRVSLVVEVDGGFHVSVSLEGTRIELEPSRRFPGLPGELSIRAVGEVFAENALAALRRRLPPGCRWRLPSSRLPQARRRPGAFSESVNSLV